MKFPENILEISKLEPNYMGFIFYEKSPRFVENLDVEIIKKIPSAIQKVAVFVNEELEKVVGIAEEYAFDLVQLHGNESPEYCEILKQKGIRIIKAFSVDEHFDFGQTENYMNSCQFYLFDTKTDHYGGSGKSFNWDILSKYDQKKPFFLSGGIDLENIAEAMSLDSMNIEALDLNSKFEKEPGVKERLKILSAKWS